MKGSSESQHVTVSTSTRTTGEVAVQLHTFESDIRYGNACANAFFAPNPAVHGNDMLVTYQLEACK